jgi:WD40 repeat protein
MEFTDLFQGTGPCAWSPEGSLLAVVEGNRLTIREASTLLVVNFFSNADTVNKIEWSSDGKYVLCAIYKQGTVQVWDVENPKWVCKISEGPAGLAYSRWGADGRSILNTNEFNVRITVWSLCSTSGAVAALRPPKFCDRAIDFSSDGKFLAVAERRDCKDYVQIYECATWAAASRFPVETRDLADLTWSPDDRTIGAILRSSSQKTCRSETCWYMTADIGLTCT